MYLYIAEHDFVSKWNIWLLISLYYFVLFSYCHPLLPCKPNKQRIFGDKALKPSNDYIASKIKWYFFIRNRHRDNPSALGHQSAD
jgi:hypothetical protein